ncbi:MAG: dihydrodipicolinate reductase [Candidatus Handelsmanbacteria bacterium]|nr:dihydrodipicolinate reductase [Candidatus Handelsmanbacteria bacterium]
MTSPLRVIQMGLGPIGQRLVQYLSQRPHLKLVGALDIDPAKEGQDAGLLSGTRALGVAVSADPTQVLGLEAQVVLLTTGSSLTRIEAQIASCVRAGKSVVSTCEELACPFDDQPHIAARLDELARNHGVAVLGTGVNPGFLMDALPLFLSSACQEVRAVEVQRHQDASIRRLPFQRKIGAGLSPEEFATQHRAGQIRHVGFAQSINLIARAFGWTLDQVEEAVEPVIAHRPTASSFIQVEAGQCAGLRQIGTGRAQGRVRITLELEAYLGHPRPHDTVVLRGQPEIRSTVSGGVDGDIATCAMVINALPALLQARPGLRTMADIPLCHWQGG